MGNDIRYMPEKLEQASNFANKIWNAAKFIINSNVDKNDIIEFCNNVYDYEKYTYNEELLSIEDKWILNKLDKLIVDVTKNIENYDLGIALDNIYGFIRDEFCDWYIEMVKPRLYSDDYETKVAVCGILNYVFGASLKLLHPFMPFVTTEIYSDLVTYSDKDLMVSKWPRIKTEFIFDKEENLAETLKEIIVEVRNIRAKMNVHPSKKVRLIFVTNKYKDEINMSKEFIMKLGFGNEVVVQANKNGIGDNAISIIKDGIELYMPLEGLVDLEEEAKRKEEEKKKIEFEIQRAEKMLSNPGFVNKAPQAKIDEEKAKLEKYKEMLKNF